MTKKNKIRYNDQACGCLIDDLLEKKEDDHNSRLCGARDSDMEFYVDPDPEKISLNFYQRHLTDGLPIIPPTKERVDRFLDYSDMDPFEVLAVLAPRMGQAIPKKIAVNAVMAGCLPTFQPIIEHSIQAISQEKFNLASLNATTHPVAVCAIINGPISNELSLNSGVGCLGPGNLTNATLGRAIRLCLINIAGAVPGAGDHATHGSPAKYSYCFAENEEESPWDLLHVERGFQQDISTLTMIAAEAPHNVNDHRSLKAEDLLDTIVNTTATAGCNNSHVPGEILVIMGPEHADLLASNGWDKIDVKQYIHENAVVPAELGDRGGRKLESKWIDSDGNVHITRNPEDVVLVVAGGPGRHTMIAHGFGTSSESVTIPITLKDGTPVSSIRDFHELKQG